MRNFSPILVFVLSLLGVIQAGAAELALGAPGLVPTADRPLGWRGDGTGCYTAATPPLEWYRRPKGAFNSIRVLAARPKGNAPEGEPLNMGAIREWLIAGPFEAKEHATALDDVNQPNEATLQPNAGEDLGGKTWKVQPVSVANQSQSWSRLTLDLALAYGKDQQQEWQNHAGTLEPLVAYASTYLFAAEPGKVQLRISGTKVKAWFNGAPVKIPGQWEPNPTIDLVQGWNRLTLKAASSKSNWNASALISPVTGTGFETKNVVWMAPMPGASWSSPVVVGPKIFVNADMGTLVCVNKQDGQVLWTRTTSFYHATSEEERKKFPDLAAKAQQLDALMTTLPNDLNAGLSVDGSKAENAAVRNKIKLKLDLERSIMDTMKKDKLYSYWDNNRGTTTPTPISDGKNVYVSYFGGDKGNGAHVIAAYDLEGKQLWSHFSGQTGIAEHGAHATPGLCGNYLVFASGNMILCFEKNTGKVVWQKREYNLGCAGSSFVAMKSGGVDAVLIPQVGIFRCTDGELLWKTDTKSDIATPLFVDGLLYGLGSTNNTSFYYAYKINEALKGTNLVKVPWKSVGLQMPGTFTNMVIGSPLYHEGLMYVVSEGGALTVLEAQTGKVVYSKALESLNPRLTYVVLDGICTGPTLAGKYIHIRDDQSQTLVIAPGREYKELGKNVLWEFNQGGNLQEAQSNPFYEGARMYYRTQGFLYCIGEK